MEKDSRYTKSPVCPNCGKTMILDDVDCQFEGCQDEYWICPDCGQYCAYSKVRYSKTIFLSIDKVE